MKKHIVGLNEFKQKGKIVCDNRENMLYMTTNHAIPSQRFDAEYLSIPSYIYLPDRYKLPLRIDITVKIDAPGFYLLLGDGRINFGTMCSDNRRMDDIAAPARKTMSFHNHMNMNEFTDISVLYDFKEMQIQIGGEERYYSRKERYMKSPVFQDRNKDGFEFKIACDKLVNLCIKSVCITEYDNTCGISRTEKDLPPAVTNNNVMVPGEKPTFERYISLLPENFRNEIIKLDEYLRAQKSLKMKRMLEKNGNKITYVSSDYGFSYALHLSNDIFRHTLQWYLITNGKPETWHRKADMMEITLESLAERNPAFAERMFQNLDECVGCYGYCLAKTRYQFRNKQKYVCHGKLALKMSISGFADVRLFIDEINRIVQENKVEVL